MSVIGWVEREGVRGSMEVGGAERYDLVGKLLCTAVPQWEGRSKLGGNGFIWCFFGYLDEI